MATLLLLVPTLCNAQHGGSGVPLVFNVNGDNAGGNTGLPTGPRSPIVMPSVTQDSHTLYLYSGCDNASLVLLDENGDSVYTAAITAGTTQIVLPSYLVGEYELRIIRGGVVFYTVIELE